MVTRCRFRSTEVLESAELSEAKVLEHTTVRGGSLQVGACGIAATFWKVAMKKPIVSLVSLRWR